MQQNRALKDAHDRLTDAIQEIQKIDIRGIGKIDPGLSTNVAAVKKAVIRELNKAKQRIRKTMIKQIEK